MPELEGAVEARGDEGGIVVHEAKVDGHGLAVVGLEVVSERPVADAPEFDAAVEGGRREGFSGAGRPAEVADEGRVRGEGVGDGPAADVPDADLGSTRVQNGLTFSRLSLYLSRVLQVPILRGFTRAHTAGTAVIVALQGLERWMLFLTDCVTVDRQKLLKLKYK